MTTERIRRCEYEKATQADDSDDDDTSWLTAAATTRPTPIHAISDLTSSRESGGGDDTLTMMTLIKDEGACGCMDDDGENTMGSHWE